MTPPAGPRPPATAARTLVTLRGRLEVQTVRAGTASERPALVLDAGRAGRWVLVRLDGPAFGLPEEARWSGREVRVSGYAIGPELRYRTIELEGDAGGAS